MDTFIPKKKLGNVNDQAWITVKAKRLCKKKMRWFKKLKEKESPKVRQKYPLIKKECNRECRSAKSQFLDKLCENKDSKLFWNRIKSKK